MYDKLWPLFLRHLATAYGYGEGRYADKYFALRNNGESGIDAANDALWDFQNDLNTIVQGVLKARLDRLDQVVFPTEIMKQVIGVEPTVEPVFTHLPEHSQLARVAFEADVFCKSLMDRPGAAVAGYQSFFDWSRARHDAAENEDGHIWTSPNGFEISESADGRTMRFGRTEMRFHMERYVGGRSETEPRLDSYAALLTGCYDDFAEQAPILHELREATKVVAVAQWLKRHNAAVSLPQDGRVYWNAPRELPGILFLTMAANSAQAGQINEILTTAGGVDFCGDNDLKYAVGSPEAPQGSFSEATIQRTKDKIEQALGKTLGGPPAPQPVGWVSSDTVGGQPVSKVSVATGNLGGRASDLSLQKSSGEEAVRMWKQGDLEAAERAYRDMAEAAKDDPVEAASARLLLAEVLHEKGEEAVAIKELNAALQLAPDLPMAQLMYAKALSDSGDKAGAQEAVRSYLLLEPTNIAAIKVLADLGDAAGAKQALKTYLTLEPKNVAAIKVLADMGDLAGAQQALETYLKLEPGNTAAAQVLADLKDRASGVAPAVATTPVPSVGTAPASGALVRFEPSVSKALDPNGASEILKNAPFYFTDIKPLILKPLPVSEPKIQANQAWQKLKEERTGLVSEYQKASLELANLEAQKATTPAKAPELEQQAAPLKQQQADLKPKIEKIEKDMVKFEVSWPGGTPPEDGSSGSTPPAGGGR